MKFPKYVHLIPDFQKDAQLEDDSEKWLQFTEVGIERRFESYLGPVHSSASTLTAQMEHDINLLSDVQKEINRLRIQASLQTDMKVLQKMLDEDIIRPLVRLNNRWMSNFNDGRGFIQ
jgi:hypothetical protein